MMKDWKKIDYEFVPEPDPDNTDEDEKLGNFVALMDPEDAPFVQAALLLSGKTPQEIGIIPEHVDSEGLDGKAKMQLIRESEKSAVTVGDMTEQEFRFALERLANVYQKLSQRAENFNATSLVGPYVRASIGDGDIRVVLLTFVHKDNIAKEFDATTAINDFAELIKGTAIEAQDSNKNAPDGTQLDLVDIFLQPGVDQLSTFEELLNKSPGQFTDRRGKGGDTSFPGRDRF